MSGVDPSLLLRRLGGLAAPGASARSVPEVGSPAFADLLAKLRRDGAGGAGVSGGAVGVERGAELSPPLNEEQMARVAQAVDRAAARGASRAVVLVDERAVRVDVLTRRVTGEAELKGGEPVVDVDAVVEAAAPREAALGPPKGSVPASLSRVLSGGSGNGSGGGGGA